MKKIGVGVAVVLPFFLPGVFIPVANALVVAANWISFYVGWDWHRLSPHYTPMWASRFINPPRVQSELWIVLSLLVLDAGALLLIKRRGLLITANVAFFGFFATAATIRLMGWV